MSRRDARTGTWSDRYEAVVRVEAAARLRTATKAFCSCAVAPAAEPNENTCPVCLGLPGTLPALNAAAVDLGARAALALGCTVALASGFAREHLPPTPLRPKGYVVTQRDRPLGTRGAVQIGETPEGSPIHVAVRCAYLGEDEGRAAYGRFADGTGLDYNLAGAPLLVVDAAPDLRSPAEARAYVASLAGVLRDAGASDARLEDETLAVTAHVALRGRGDLKAGAECSLANLRTLDDVKRAVEAECARQGAVRDVASDVEPRPMLWDPASGAVAPARAPHTEPWRLVDPDLPPLVLTAEWIAARRAELPELQPARRERFHKAYGLAGPALDTFSADAELAGYFETLARLHGDGPGAARWLEAHALPFMAREGLAPRDVAVRVRPADLARLLDLRRAGGVSEDAAERVFRAMLRTGLGVARAAEREGFVLDAPR